MPFGMIGNIASSAINAGMQASENEKNRAEAREYAKNSMQWKAEDLRKAGINPIYGLGAGGYSAPLGTAPQVDIDTKGLNKLFIKEQKELAKAQSRKIQSEANLNNAVAQSELNKSVPITEAERTKAKTMIAKQPETQSVMSGSQMYSYGMLPDGSYRLIPSSEGSEATDATFGMTLANTYNSFFGLTENARNEKERNFARWNETARVYNPLTHEPMSDWKGNIKIVPAGSKAKKRADIDKKGAKMMNAIKEVVPVPIKASKNRRRLGIGRMF